MIDVSEVVCLIGILGYPLPVVDGKQRERVSSVTWEDLQCGEAINVYGRHLLLMACDSSTKDWYARRGMKQRTLTVSQGEVEVRQ